MNRLITIIFISSLLIEAWSLKCFKCDSGDPKKANFDCPMEGQVAYPKVEMSRCHGKCYIRTKAVKGGAIIQRGCLPTSWLKRYLKDGCDVLGEDIWCFCSRDGCNGKRLGQWFPII